MAAPIESTCRLSRAEPESLFERLHWLYAFCRELQRRIILEAFDHLIAAEQSGDIRRLPVTRAEGATGGKVERAGVEFARLNFCGESVT